MKITLSPKHGLNPSLGVCFVCGQEDGSVVIPGRLPDDAEAPRRAVWTREPCETCLGYMVQGIILISVRDGENGDNPYRTGGWAVVTEVGLRGVMSVGPTLEAACQKRMAFVPDRVWDGLGLPRTPAKGE